MTALPLLTNRYVLLDEGIITAACQEILITGLRCVDNICMSSFSPNLVGKKELSC